MFTTPPSVWRATRDLHRLIGKRGVVRTCTRIFQSPKGVLRQPPYYVALITIPELGTEMIMEICGQHAELVPGAAVVLLPRKQRVSPDGLIQYGIKACIV